MTKQLVLRIALPHITLFVVAVGYALMGCWVLTAINYKDDGSVEAVQAITECAIKKLFLCINMVDCYQKLFWKNCF